MIADEVDRTHERVHVTRNGREHVVLFSAEDLESLEATIELPDHLLHARKSLMPTLESCFRRS